MINAQCTMFTHFIKVKFFTFDQAWKNKRIIINLPLQKNERGFTFIELVIIVGVIGTLFAVATINLSKAQRSSTVTASVQTLLADIKQQQLKAMVGATEGRSQSDSYGLYLESTRYTLFHGIVYNSSDPTNFVVQLGTPLALSTTIPSGLLVFSRQSGEVASFTPGSNTITVRNPSGGEQEILTINRYGVVTGIQ